MQKIILIMDTWPNILALSTWDNKSTSLIQFDWQLGTTHKSINLQFSESLLIEHLHLSLHLVDWRVNLLPRSINNGFTNRCFKQKSVSELDMIKIEIWFATTPIMNVWFQGCVIWSFMSLIPNEICILCYVSF